MDLFCEMADRFKKFSNHALRARWGGQFRAAEIVMYSGWAMSHTSGGDRTYSATREPENVPLGWGFDLLF